MANGGRYRRKCLRYSMRNTSTRDAGYTWDWGEGGRAGSWKPDGEESSINRYVIDFATGVQTNLDNQRKRSIRVIWVRPQDVVPQFTGQLPTTLG